MVSSAGPSRWWDFLPSLGKDRVLPQGGRLGVLKCLRRRDRQLLPSWQPCQLLQHPGPRPQEQSSLALAGRCRKAGSWLSCVPAGARGVEGWEREARGDPPVSSSLGGQKGGQKGGRSGGEEEQGREAGLGEDEGRAEAAWGDAYQAPCGSNRPSSQGLWP